MDDLKEFLLAAKKAITDLEIPIPGNVTGPKKDTGSGNRVQGPSECMTLFQRKKITFILLVCYNIS